MAEVEVVRVTGRVEDLSGNAEDLSASRSILSISSNEEDLSGSLKIEEEVDFANSYTSFLFYLAFLLIFNFFAKLVLRFNSHQSIILSYI